MNADASACETAQCTCMDGVATNGGNDAGCTEHGLHRCSSCDEGYVLSTGAGVIGGSCEPTLAL